MSEERVQDLERELAQLRVRAEQEVAARDRTIARLRDEMQTMRRFERQDAVGDTIRRVAQLVDLDPARAVSRMAGQLWGPTMLSFHRDVLPFAITWLQEYHDCIVKAIGPAGPEPQELPQRRARRALDEDE